MIKSQREAFGRRERNKKIFNYSIIAVVAVAIIYGGYAMLKPEGPSEHDDLAKCLSAQGVTMYGTEWCTYCQAQKREFGSSFKYVTYINCDVNPDACKAAGVEGYPAWAMPDGTLLSGVQDLAVLAERAGCTV